MNIRFDLDTTNASEASAFSKPTIPCITFSDFIF